MPRERVGRPPISTSIDTNPAAIRVPTPNVTQPAAAVTAPPAQAPAPTRIWRGDDHVGNAPPRVRRGGPDSVPITAAPTPLPSTAPVQPPSAAPAARIAAPTPPPAAVVPRTLSAPPAPVAPAPPPAAPRAIAPIDAGHPPGAVPQQWHGRRGREDVARPVQVAPPPPPVTAPPVAAPARAAPAPAAPLEQPAVKSLRAPEGHDRRGERGAQGRERN
jgi:hypothetical protein